MESPDVTPAPDTGQGSDVLPADSSALPQLDLAELAGGTTQNDQPQEALDITAPPERGERADALDSAAQHSGAAALEQTVDTEPLQDVDDTADPIIEGDSNTPVEADGEETHDVQPADTSDTDDQDAPQTEAGTDNNDPPDNDTPRSSQTEFPDDPSGPDLPEPPTKGDLYHNLHPVGRYTSKDWSSEVTDEGDTVRIPTSLTERTTFTNRHEDWLTNRTMAEYRESIFEDAAPDIAPECANIAGGEPEAFKGGKTVLDVGSGEAVALLQFAEAYPDTTFIGVDLNYAETRTIEPNRPGVQLTKDDWSTLSQIPTASIDTIISQRGVIPWGISPHRPESGQIADALTRVAKPGAVWRFDVSPHPVDRSYVTSLMQARGWTIREVYTTSGEMTETVVAIKSGNN